MNVISELSLIFGIFIFIGGILRLILNYNYIIFTFLCLGIGILLMLIAGLTARRKNEVE